jgi:putative transcriptional regulator
MNSGDNLTGSLLVAHPSLRDPNFRRSIVFLSQHSAEDGAVGFVLNRPVDVFQQEKNPDIPVYFGGPVDAGTMLLASIQWRENPALVAFRAFGAVDDLADREGWGNGLRIFVGYSGWTAGQLEHEIELNSWIVIPPTRSLILMEAPETAWIEIMRNSGPFLRLMAEAPDDPSLN